VLFVTELLQSLKNGHANESGPQRNQSRQRSRRVVSATDEHGLNGFSECGDMSPLSKRGHVRALQRDAQLDLNQSSFWRGAETAREARALPSSQRLPRRDN